VATFYVQNFGCRATQADGAAIERQFEEQGLERASGARDAEVVVLNTCTVTASADRDARAAIRRVHRENPHARIVVTGCYAQRSPAELASLPGVTQVIGNSHKHQLAEIAIAHTSESQTPDRILTAQAFVPLAHLATTHSGGGGQRRTDDDRPPIFVSDIFAHTELLAAPVFDSANERTRPNLKVQDGCDNRCSFCVIPFVRGHSRSLRLDEVLRQVNALAAAGYRELVISGINLGRWGRDLEWDNRPQVSGSKGRPTDDDRQFAFLVRSILDYTSLEKLRISSVEPTDWSDELIALVANSPRIAKHAHVPMQSGSDTVLRRMHRKYRPWHYRAKIEKIRAAMPCAAIGADVMVGFPGETDAEFEDTRRMIEDLPFTYLHVFTYSARPGTPAAALPDQVPLEVVRHRNRLLRELAARKKLAFMHSFVGRTLDAITLAGASANTGGKRVPVTEALTDNYLSLHLRGRWQPNRWMRARIETVQDGSLVGAAC
jgi:threonylcarbamoyladenosine tRNA methylthiotransferase MtaB